MSGRVVLATAARVGAQLRRDHRTLALILVVPSALLLVLRYVLDGQPQAFDRVGTPLVGLFPLIIMFLITSIAVLRERTTGTLERLMSLPLAKLDLLLGYAVAFACVAVVQGGLTAGFAFGLLGLEADGPIWAIVVLAVANALLGMALGLFLSAFAHSEFQAVQFMPAFVLPQLLLSGLFVPRGQMPEVLRTAADLLPFTYAFDALSRVAVDDLDARLWLDVGVVIGCIGLALVLGAATLRRRTG